MMSRIQGWLRGVAFVVVAMLLLTGTPALARANDGMSMGTPPAMPSGGWSCETAGTPVAAMDHDDMGSMKSTPAAYEFDQLYIDMMLPHHGSIVALAEAALPRLSDPRLIEIAHNIIATQSAEQKELEGYRTAWYGSPTPDLSSASMSQMMKAMPDMGSDMTMMMNEMNASWQVSTFCAASNPDLAFIEQTIPHHQMAIDGSKDGLGKFVHPELKSFAEKVIAGQQAQIDELNAIKTDLTATATPSS
jgi:uncharacterized protein (DUF305 family)